MKPVLRSLFAYTVSQLDLLGAMDHFRDRVDALIDRTGSGRPLRVVSFGKAAVGMVEWLRHAHPRMQVVGVLAAPFVSEQKWSGIDSFAGGHPVPNAGSLRAAAASVSLLEETNNRDSALFLVSGGGSALHELPISPSVHLEDLRELNRILVSCGADIVEVNTIRKHLSAVKGGRLAQAAYPARQLTLYVSDVPPGRDSSVASGPTMPDESTLEEFHAAVSKYGLLHRLPEKVRSVIEDPALPETPKPGDRCFDRSQWICILDNGHAVEAVKRFADDQGWRTVVDNSVDDLDVAVAADRLLTRLRELRGASTNGVVCVVSGGELSSPVRGSGIGGRNQAFVLECARRIRGEAIAVLSAGTDGVDGNSPAAGAVADGDTRRRAENLGMNAKRYLEASDSYSFFHRLGDELTCGATGNNVRDIRVLVAF